MREGRCTGLALAFGLAFLVQVAGPAAAMQVPPAARPASATPQSAAEAAWRAVKARMEAGPILLGSPSPLTVRLTGEPCNSRLVPIDTSGPSGGGGLIRWRELGQGAVQPVQGGHVVSFPEAGFWLGFPPFDAAEAERTAGLFNALVRQCQQFPLPDSMPASDRYRDLGQAFERLKTELEAIQATDTVSRRFTYRVEMSTSPCHFNAKKYEPGTTGRWLDDNTVYVASGTRFSLPPALPLVSIVDPVFGARVLETGTVARAETVFALLNSLKGLCAEFQSERS